MRATTRALTAAGVLVCALSMRGDDSSVAERYRADADRLIDAAMADDEGYAKLAYLCDRIGNRLSGSASLQRAIEWGADQMRRDGLSNVRVLPVKVPHWVRGAESGAILEPVARPLHLLGLGGSVATPRGGVTAETVAVSNFDELAKLGRAKVSGKIVVYNYAWTDYGGARNFRSNGASRAAALGAVAALVRSATGLAMQEAHTGAMNYDAAQPRIPVAAISPEDAAMIARLNGQGVTVKVHMEMNARTEADVESGDVIGEIPGSERPDEIVVMGGHIDSWDVGQGAHDDGGGMIAALQAAALIKKLVLHPRRTVRVAFWVNEENGGRGGNAYRDWAGEGVRNHVAAIESDGGSETPVGFGFALPSNGPAPQTLRDIAKILERVGAGTLGGDGKESDTGPLIDKGVPGLALRTTMAHYFDWHHTQADTLDKVDPTDFRKNIAAMAVMSYILADMPERLR